MADQFYTPGFRREAMRLEPLYAVLPGTLESFRAHSGNWVGQDKADRSRKEARQKLTKGGQNVGFVEHGLRPVAKFDSEWNWNAHMFAAQRLIVDKACILVGWISGKSCSS